MPKNILNYFKGCCTRTVEDLADNQEIRNFIDSAAETLIQFGEHQLEIRSALELILFQLPEKPRKIVQLQDVRRALVDKIRPTVIETDYEQYLSVQELFCSRIVADLLKQGAYKIKEPDKMIEAIFKIDIAAIRAKCDALFEAYQGINRASAARSEATHSEVVLAPALDEDDEKAGSVSVLATGPLAGSASDVPATATTTATAMSTTRATVPTP